MKNQNPIWEQNDSKVDFKEICLTLKMKMKFDNMILISFFCVCVCVYLSRATPMGHGGSQPEVQLELQPLACAIATATPNLSRICDRHHSPQQSQIPNPLSKARDGTCVLMDTIGSVNGWAKTGSPFFFFLRATPTTYGGSRAMGSNWSHSCRPMS